jgi:hypothetical protein
MKLLICVGTSWVSLCAFAQSTRPLNDTGSHVCGGSTSGNNPSCIGFEPAGQDREYGRDAKARAGTLTKVGASSGATDGTTNGFDYSKISNSGSVLPETAVLGAGPNDWACTHDNHTGLTWEVKTSSGLRSQNSSYTWYLTSSVDGNNGLSNGGTCAIAGRCDSEKYVTDVNRVGLCGFSDWRIPSMIELHSIADYGRLNAAIDPVYFPNTPVVLSESLFLSRNPYARGNLIVWMIDFYTGGRTLLAKSRPVQIRLVRSNS